MQREEGEEGTDEVSEVAGVEGYDQRESVRKDETGEVGAQHSASHKVLTSSGVKSRWKVPVDKQSSRKASGLFTLASPRN